MAIQNSISQWLLDGDPDIGLKILGVAGNTNIVIPAGGAKFWPGSPHAGYVRIKQSTLNLNANVKISPIQATDGTNIANLYLGDPYSRQNNEYIDSSFFFNYDWPVTNISFNCVTTNNSATFDVEVAGMR
jgi:hypothetical protein